MPHDGDWTYSLVFPPSHPWCGWEAAVSYCRIHEWLQRSFKALGAETTLSACCEKALPGQCFVGAERHDLLQDGRKLAGAAQRRNRLGLLVQGSVQPAGTPIGRADWERAMLAGSPIFGEITWSEFSLDDRLRKRVAELVREKFGNPAYNQKR